jgi:predicted  nucleic acid-binding Zn-ribbon protein
MPASPSVMSLHLQYRLWIAELNFDINVLRIFADYLTELRTKRKEADVKTKSDHFEKQFQALRTEIDEIRHEMHIAKMKLGANARDAKPFDYKDYNKESHSPLKKRLSAYKDAFKNIKKEFGDFEGQWLS